MKGRFSLHFDTDSFDKFQDLDFPLENFRGHVVGSCSGLLCLADYDDFSYSSTCNVSLWNPTVRKCITLPPSSIFHDFYFESLGFGFDSVSNDYKVMMIWFRKKEIGYACYSNRVVGIYSLSSNSWRDISETALSYDVVGFRSEHIFLSGAVHWILICRGRGFEEFSKKILRFDQMCLPNSLVTEKVMDLSIAVFGEQLSIVCLDLDTFDIANAWSVWVMMEYGVSESWTKQFRISLQAFTGRTQLRQVLGMRENGELILLVDKRYRQLLFSYNPECRQVTDLNIQTMGDTWYLNSFVKSLVLLGHVNKISWGREYSIEK